MQLRGPYKWWRRKRPRAVRFDLSRAVFCLWWLAAPASAAAPADEPPPAPVPEYFQRLIETANVRIEFYDPGQKPSRPRGHSAFRPGFSTFRLEVNHRFTFQFQAVDRPDGRRVTIRPKLEEITYRLQNRVQLPGYLETERRWHHSLVKHEFDHVAITVDPRVRMLFGHLYGHLGPVVREVTRDVPIDARWVQAVVDGEVAARRQALLDLLVANEEFLDVATRHGAVRLKDRKAFFRALFSEENLRQQKFPYLNEVRDLVRQPKYLEAELPYRFD
jgi:hypothetical protein